MLSKPPQKPEVEQKSDVAAIQSVTKSSTTVSSKTTTDNSKTTTDNNTTISTASQKQSSNPIQSTESKDPVKLTETNDSSGTEKSNKSFQSAENGSETLKSAEPAQSKDDTQLNKLSQSNKSETITAPTEGDKSSQSLNIDSLMDKEPSTSDTVETNTSKPLIVNDNQYKQKLEKTIESCKNSLGVENVEVSLHADYD